MDVARKDMAGDWLNRISPVPRIVGRDRAQPDRASPRRLTYDHQGGIFKEQCGVKPLQYVNSLLVERAKNLLRGGRHACRRDCPPFGSP
jgi:hypothetical protein